MDKQTDPTRLVRPEGLAEHWDCSRAYIYRMLDEGLPSMKLGRSRRIRISDADAWLANRLHQSEGVAS